METETMTIENEKTSIDENLFVELRKLMVTYIPLASITCETKSKIDFQFYDPFFKNVKLTAYVYNKHYVITSHEHSGIFNHASLVYSTKLGLVKEEARLYFDDTKHYYKKQIADGWSLVAFPLQSFIKNFGLTTLREHLTGMPELDEATTIAMLDYLTLRKTTEDRIRQEATREYSEV